jgi:8-oxo-dGTP pyrophosphatase MutT (NUDIX family)
MYPQATQRGRRNGCARIGRCQTKLPSFALPPRVLLIDAADRILLLRWKLEEGDIWILPGGGLNENETFEEAALRELWEETGIGDVDLGPCVWVRTHLIPWDGKVYKRQERFYPVLVDEAEVSSVLGRP